MASAWIDNGAFGKETENQIYTNKDGVPKFSFLTGIPSFISCYFFKNYIFFISSLSCIFPDTGVIFWIILYSTLHFYLIRWLLVSFYLILCFKWYSFIIILHIFVLHLLFLCAPYILVPTRQYEIYFLLAGFTQVFLYNMNDSEHFPAFMKSLVSDFSFLRRIFFNDRNGR